MSNFGSSSDEEDGILKKALDVELPKDFDPSKAPTTGEEYLHHVIYERKKCRKWITVDIDPSKLNNKETISINLNQPIKKAPIAILPTQKWQEKQVTDFLKLRKFVTWQTKNEPENDLIHDSHYKKLILDTKPTFSQLTNLKQNAKMKLLNLIGEYLNETGENGVVNANVGIWIYGTLATLELPLDPNDCHELRELAREIALVRSRLRTDASEKDYKYLNLCICLIARVFGQIDLADI